MARYLRLICLALCAALLVGGPAAVATAEPDPIDIIVRSVGTGNNAESFENPVGAIVYEKFGINFKYEYSVGEEMEVIALMIMSGNLPDVILPHYNIAPFVEAGVALDLTDYILEYAPLYRERLGNKWDRMIWGAEDSGRYYLTGPEQYPEQFDGRNWFFMQHAVVKELGYPPITSLAEYEGAIRDYLALYPEIDGQPTIGMSMVTDGWIWILNLTNPAMMAAGTQSSGEYYVDPETMKVTYRVLREEEREYFRWLNHMYNEGLLDQESFTQTEDQYKAKVAQGRVLATTAMGWYLQWGPEQTLRQDGKFDRTYGAYPIVLEDGIVNSNFSGSRCLDTPGLEGLISTDCKYPERLMTAIDYFISDEGQILNNWGIAGETYDIVDGLRQVRIEVLERRLQDPDFTKNTGIGTYGFLPGYVDGTKDASGQYYTMISRETMIAAQPDIEREVLAGYGIEIWADFFAQPEEFPIRMWPGESGGNTRLDADSAGAIAFQRCMDVVKTGVIKAIVASPADFDDAWDAFKDEMVRNGVDSFTEAIEEANAAALELWGFN